MAFRPCRLSFRSDSGPAEPAPSEVEGDQRPHSPRDSLDSPNSPSYASSSRPKELGSSYELTPRFNPLHNRALADSSERRASSPLLPGGIRSHGGLPPGRPRRRGGGATLCRRRGVLAE